MSLFGSLYVGASGLQNGQNALNTVAHNISNEGTTGYTRQQVALTDRDYNMLAVTPSIISNKQLGLGVVYSEVRYVRDAFLDEKYRRESGRSMFYQVSYETFSEVETILGEFTGKSFSESIDNLWDSVEELTKNPASSVNQGLLIQRCSQFIERAANVYNAFCDYQNNLNRQVKGYVDQINTYASRIYELNKSITKIECGGIEHANDLRDERNYILDQLAKLGSISYEEEWNGGLIVKFEGHMLVDQVQTFKMGADLNQATGFYTPFWQQDALRIDLGNGNYKYDLSSCKVFDLTQEMSTACNTDIGALKATLLARGDHKANHTDLMNPANDPERYDREIASSIMMNVQAEFDNLVYNIVTELNKVLADAAQAATKANPNSNYLRNEDGTVLQLFQRISTEDYEDDGAGNLVLKPEYYGKGQENTLFTVLNLRVNPDLVKEPSRLGFITDDDKEDFAIATAMQMVFENKNYVLNPNVETKTDLRDYYNNIVDQVGNAGMVFRSVYENEVTTTKATDDARQQVAGVSDDEELSNMIRFQNGYNAASRYINVIDEMIEHILNTLGR